MKAKILLIISGFVLTGVVNTSAQTLSPSVYPSYGKYDVQSNGSLSWTLGETESNTWIVGSNVLSEGFQQPEIQILTGTVGTSFCAGVTSVSVPFTSDGYVDASNVFTAQLSDASGSFASPTTIGTYTGSGTDIAGTINATLPGGLSGSGYRIRVVGSAPVFFAPDNGTDISISSTDTWSGSGGTDWFTAGNWSCGVPSPGTDVLIPTSAENFPIISGGPGGPNATANNLIIQSGASVDVQGVNDIELEIYGDLSNSGTASLGAGTSLFEGSAAQTISGANTFANLTINNSNGVTITSGSGNSLNVSGTLTLALGTLYTNGNLTITSTASGTGEVDDFSGSNSGNISGNLTVQRYVVNPTPSHTTGISYYFIGTPVSGATINQWNNEFTNTAIDGATNGSYVIPTASCSDVNVASNSPYGGLFEYNESVVTTCNQSGWATMFSGTIPTGQGFAGQAPNGTTLALTGSYNTGDISSPALTVTATNLTETPGFGWNIISNPYASPIHWLSVASANSNLSGTAYTYITSGVDAGTYNAVNEITYETSGLDELGSSEAFWVEATANNSTVSFTNSMRSDGSNSFLRAAPVWDQLLSLSVSGNGYNDALKVAFGPKFTNGFDAGYDAHKLMGRSVQPNVYVTDSVAKYCIYAIPTLTENERDIPVSFTPGTSGQFSFSIDLNGFDPTALVFLEDLQTHTLQNLMVSNTYSFASDVSDDPARFVLHFVPAAVITATAADCIGNDGSVLVDLGKYNVDNTTITWDSYTLKDDNNNVIAVGNNVNGQLTIGNLPGGVYILQLTLGSYVVNEQVVVTSVTSVSAKFATDGNQVQTGAQVQFTNATTGATTYDWSFGDGASSSQLNPTHSYSSAGDYQVLLTATNDSCTGTYSQTITVANVATGINNVSDASATITGYANSVSINFHSFTQLDEVTLNIYDVTGRKIITTQTISTGDSRHVINVDDIASGYYFVVLTGQDYEKAGKVFLTGVN